MRYTGEFPLTCQRCLTPFVGARSHIKWCSRACASLADRERRGIQPKRYDRDTVERVLLQTLGDAPQVRLVMEKLP